MKKHLLTRIGREIDKNRVVKMINNKLGKINHFLDEKFESKEKMSINMKDWSIKKKWSPFERKLMKVAS